MRTYEIVVTEDNKLALTIGETKGGLMVIDVEAEYVMTADEAREMGEELIRSADLLNSV